MNSQTSFPPLVNDNRWNKNHFNRHKDVASGPLGIRHIVPPLSEYHQVYSEGGGVGVAKPNSYRGVPNPITGEDCMYSIRMYMYVNGHF